MKTRSFRGGIDPLGHIRHGKAETDRLPIQTLSPPAKVTIPMSRITGTTSHPVVQAGDVVCMGQKIGEAEGFLGADIHASVSGTVEAVNACIAPTGRHSLAVVIANDCKDTPDPSLHPYGPLEDMTPEQIREMIFQCGIVGLGGATFPTHVKLSVPEGKKVDLLILNGAECEPYLNADHRLMVECPKDVIQGMRILMKALGVQRSVIGVESNKMDAIQALRNAGGTSYDTQVVPLRVKYPQGAEKQLIMAAAGRIVPVGGLPMDAGVVVINVGTAASIAVSMKTGMPLIDRIVTVSGGGVQKPGNLRVRIGTSIEECIQACGGYRGQTEKIVAGGPMMGVALFDSDVPVIAGTSGILVLTKEEAHVPEPTPCIRCGRCIRSCPMGLMPLSIARAAEANMLDEAERLQAMSCVECGACTYICPARRHLVQSIRLAKAALTKRRSQKKKEG